MELKHTSVQYFDINVGIVQGDFEIVMLHDSLLDKV